MKQESKDAIMAGLLNDILDLAWEENDKFSVLSQEENQWSLSPGKQPLQHSALGKTLSSKCSPDRLASVCVCLLWAVNLRRYGNLTAAYKSFFRTWVHQQMVMKRLAVLSKQRYSCIGRFWETCQSDPFYCINISKWASENPKHTHVLWAFKAF